MSSASNGAGGGAPLPETEALLNRVAGMISGARALPLSSSVKLDNKEEILELLREASERLPEEVRQGRWMLKEREEYLAATKRQAEELVESARSEAQRLVQRTEILKEAQAQARRVMEEARDEARRLRLEAEDYADQKLAHFEIVLERTLKTVASVARPPHPPCLRPRCQHGRGCGRRLYRLRPSRHQPTRFQPGRFQPGRHQRGRC